MNRRIVITGMDLLTCCGDGLEKTWEAVKAGRSGIRKITRFNTQGYPSRVAGEIHNFDPLDHMEPKEARRMDRFSQFGVAVSKRALRDADLDPAGFYGNRMGIIMGSAVGGMDFAEDQHAIFLEKGLRRVSPYLAISLFPGASAAQLAIQVGVKGINLTMSTACAAGADAVGLAIRSIRDNDADACVVCGSEAPLTPLTFGAFTVIKALSCRNDEPERASRPFDMIRDGFVMSEGAGALVLEEMGAAEKRGARIYAELMGYGTTCDAYHMTQPEPDAEACIQAIRLAIEDSGVNTEDVDYINAHGTSTPLNDSNETKVIKAVFGERASKIPISAVKSVLGHALGASGIIEVVITVKSLVENFIPPTTNHEYPDPECDLDYVPNKGREYNSNVALSNTFGFGGKNSVILLRRYEQ